VKNAHDSNSVRRYAEVNDVTANAAATTVRADVVAVLRGVGIAQVP